MIDVLIVGAGPGGLALASLLACYDVNLRIIESDPGPTTQSRATLIHVRTLELLNKLDIAEQMIAEGVKISNLDLMTHGKLVAQYPLVPPTLQETNPTPFPYALALPQGRTQQLLLDFLARQKKEVEWQKSLLSFTQAPAQVSAVVGHADGQEEIIDARWLVGADGAKSVVRHQLGVPFEGGTYEQTAFLADVDLDANLPRDRQTLNLAHGGFVGILPLPSGASYRLFGALSPAFAARFQGAEGSTLPLGDLQRWFDQYFMLDARITRLYWATIYRLHSRLADSFQGGRALLVGDAAHIHSPAGGQGLNLAIGDAFNLAWKLALTLKGQVHPCVLESYEKERLPTARAVLKGADRGFEIEASTNLVVEQFRLHVLPVLIQVLKHSRVFTMLFYSLFTQIWISYPHSPIVAGVPTSKRIPGAGARAPYDSVELGSDGEQGIVDLLKGPEHHLLWFEGLGNGQQEQPGDQSQVQALLAHYRVAVRIHPIARRNIRLHRRYGADAPCFILVRPDGYVAYRGERRDLAGFKAYLERIFLPA
jgi:2-polyprenyl-6-methoxyphenol hydroxylase-like FAD-dependent oxidoreductase